MYWSKLVASRDDQPLSKAAYPGHQVLQKTLPAVARWIQEEDANRMGNGPCLAARLNI